jgi:hypothetical protein
MPYQVIWRDPKTGRLETSRVFDHEWEARDFATKLARQGIDWWSIRWISPV